MSNKTLRAQLEAHDAVLQMCSDTYNAALEFDKTIVQTMNRMIAVMEQRKDDARAQLSQTLEVLDRDILELQHMRDEAQAGVLRITQIVGADNQTKELEDHTNVDETADES